MNTYQQVIRNINKSTNYLEPILKGSNKNPQGSNWINGKTKREIVVSAYLIGSYLIHIIFFRLAQNRIEIP